MPWPVREQGRRGSHRAFDARLRGQDLLGEGRRWRALKGFKVKCLGLYAMGETGSEARSKQG